MCIYMYMHMYICIYIHVCLRMHARSVDAVIWEMHGAVITLQHTAAHGNARQHTATHVFVAPYTQLWRPTHMYGALITGYAQRNLHTT